MKIIYCGELIRTPDAYDHRGIIQGLQQLGITFKIVDPILFPEKVVQECNDFKADLIIHGNTDSLDHDWVRHINGRQVFFMGDYQPDKEHYGNWNKWVENAKGIEAIFISNRDQIPLWQEDFKVPAYFWPHGCYVPDRLEYDSSYDRGLLFVGAMNDGPYYRNRKELIEEIASKVPDFTHVNSDTVEGRNKIWRDMPKLYHSSKAVLDVSHYWEVDGYASGRFWYSAGLGACSITKRFPNCEQFYPKGTKWYFDTANEAVELYGWLIKHENARVATKQRAYEWNKSHHSYVHRFKEMFGILKIKI